MKRRTFTQQVLTATGLASMTAPIATATSMTANASATDASATDASAFSLLYAPHFGMFENSAGKDPIDQIKFMYDNGFRAIEDNGMMSKPPELQQKIGDTLEKLGMTMGVFVVSFDNWPPKSTLTTGDKAWREAFLKKCKEAVEVAKRCRAKWMTVVPGNFDRNLPLGIQTAHVIESLRQASAIFEPHGQVMVLEALSDNPDLFLRYSDQTYMICKAVNSPACKFLFDMWHIQRNEGRLLYHIDLTWEEIGYFQIGDEPGRKEPTTGEVNYKHIFKYIREKSQAAGRNFVLGMEHGNAFAGKEGELKLIEAYRWCDK